MLYLFDIDGTILLSGGAGSRAINAIFRRRYDLDGAMDDVSAGGKTDPQIIREIFDTRMAGRDVDDAEVNDIIDEYVPLLRQELPLSDNFRMMPNIEQALSFLEDETESVLTIATGNVQGGARAKLEHVGMWERFITGGYGDDAVERWGIVATAIERGQQLSGRQYDKRDIVVVGDTPRDITAARQCGVTVVAVATGRPSKQQLVDCQPDAVFETLAELPAWHRQHVGA